MSARIESVQSASKAGPAEKPAPYESPEYADANSLSHQSANVVLALRWQIGGGGVAYGGAAMRTAYWRRPGEIVDDRLADGGQARLRRRPGDSSPRSSEAARLEEGVGDHCHEGVTVQAYP